MGLFNFLNSSNNKEELINELVNLAKEITNDMNQLNVAYSGNGHKVNSQIRNSIQSLGQKLNKAYDLKKKIGAQSDNIVFNNGFSDNRIPSFFWGQKMAVEIMEKQTGISFNLNF